MTSQYRDEKPRLTNKIEFSRVFTLTTSQATPLQTGTQLTLYATTNSWKARRIIASRAIACIERSHIAIFGAREARHAGSRQGKPSAARDGGRGGREEASRCAREYTWQAEEEGE